MASYIDNIKEIAIDNKFYPTTQDDMRLCLANYLPNGLCFAKKGDSTSNLYALLNTLALSFSRITHVLDWLMREYYIYTSTILLPRWEQAVGIPDGCFSSDVPIEQRRKQVICKLAIDNVITKDDWIALAAFFGATIRIQPYAEVTGSFPYTFPMTFSLTPKQAKFTMVITFVGFKDIGFPYTFPLIFGDDFPFNFLICLFNKLKPANIYIMYRFSET